MNNQKFMGKGQLLERLADQVGDRKLAIGILQKRGHISSDGKSYTKEGLKRNAMTAEERAKDRASKITGKPSNSFKYNPIKNSVKNK